MDNMHYKLLDKSSIKKVLGKNTQIQPTSHASGNYRVDANVLRIDMMLGSPAHIEVGVSSRTRHTSSNDPGANILALVLITTFTITRYHQTAGPPLDLPSESAAGKHQSSHYVLFAQRSK